MSITYDRTRSRGGVAPLKTGEAKPRAPGHNGAAPGGDAAGAQPFASLPAAERLATAYARLDGLRQINGGYAAPGATGDVASARGEVFRLRDTIYATYAAESVGAPERAAESQRLVVNIFQRRQRAIREAACAPHAPGVPAEAAVPERVHPITLEPISTGSLHLSLDTLGHFLFRTGDLMRKGFRVISPDQTEVQTLLRDILLYLSTAAWHTNPDFGMWDDGPALRSSSVGAVLAGLAMWSSDGYYDHRYSGGVDIRPMLPVPLGYIDSGRAALERLLPSESAARPVDLSQLALIWPYAVISGARGAEVISRVEKELVRSRGTIRFAGDGFMASDPADPAGGEAEWPLGLAWLSIAYSELAMRAALDSDAFSTPDAFVTGAERCLERLESVMTPDGRVPEYFTGGIEGHGAALAWPQSLYVVARKSLDRVCEHLGWR